MPNHVMKRCENCAVMYSTDVGSYQSLCDDCTKEIMEYLFDKRLPCKPNEDSNAGTL